MIFLAVSEGQCIPETARFFSSFFLAVFGHNLNIFSYLLNKFGVLYKIFSFQEFPDKFFSSFFEIFIIRISRVAQDKGGSFLSYILGSLVQWGGGFGLP